MEQLDQSILTAKQVKALSELKQELVRQFDVDSLVLFGSVVRG